MTSHVTTIQVLRLGHGTVLLHCHIFAEPREEGWLRRPPELPPCREGDLFEAQIDADVETFAALKKRPGALRGFKPAKLISDEAFNQLLEGWEREENPRGLERRQRQERHKAARRRFRRRMKRLEKRAVALGVPGTPGTLHQARAADGDPKRCNVTFDRWAGEERKAVGRKDEPRRGWRPLAPWLDSREETGQRHRRRAHLYERAAHLVARLHQELAS